MTASSHRFRTFLLAVLFAMLLLVLFARRTSAGRGAESVEVHETAAPCPLVSRGID